MAIAQQPTNISGDYAGDLAGLPIKLHLTDGPDGTLSGTVDSPNQGAAGIPCAGFHRAGDSLSFTIPSIHGTWNGKIESNGLTLSGIWNQGTPTPIVFARDTFVAAKNPSRVDGFWLGSLAIEPNPLRIQITAKSDEAGQEFCSFDSLDERATGLTCTNVTFDGHTFSFDVPLIGGHWTGTLLSTGKTLKGTWTQSGPMALDFDRQMQALSVTPKQPPTFDAAMPPVPVTELGKVLARDLATALKSGALKAGTGAGVSIGVVQHGVQKIFAYGAAQPDSIYEIGSITKTFTGLMLSQMVLQGKVRLDQPVRELLPAGTVAKPPGEEIRLVDLSTQHSGLPRMPDNFNPANNANPYADYGTTDLYAFMSKHGVAKPANAPFLYSNLGVGLLGQALANRAGTSYENLLEQEITRPLGMTETVVTMRPELRSRFIVGHDANHQPASAWDLTALAGAGAIRSSAKDMLTYLEANLHPEKYVATRSLESESIAAALKQAHELRGEAWPGGRIGLGWLYDPSTQMYWHSGGTGGYTSYAMFNPQADYAVIVLSNTAGGPNGMFADLLALHIRQRLDGKPAISLGGFR
jgi:D-alanyl-D-alanine-carboxypeptidase/D-alanyl-D-alanine-endopeptidase